MFWGVLFDFAHGTPFGEDVSSNIVGFAFVGHEPYSYVRRVEKRYQFADNFSIIKGSQTRIHFLDDIVDIEGVSAL